MDSCEKSRFVRDSEEYCFGHVWLKNQVQYPSVVLIKWTIGCANENVEFIIFFLGCLNFHEVVVPQITLSLSW